MKFFMKRRITLLLLCMLPVFAVTIAQRYAVKKKRLSTHVEFTVIDGLRPETYLHTLLSTPNFQYLKNNGAHPRAVRFIFPATINRSGTTIAVTGNGSRCCRQLVVHGDINAARD
jgi:hypothetical protein